MSRRDPLQDALGPRVRTYHPGLERVVAVRLTWDDRLPGFNRFRGQPIYSQHHSSGELGEVHWYRNRPSDDGDAPGTWTVSTKILCGEFHFVTGAVVDDFGTLVLPNVVDSELRSIERRRAARGLT